ncbi:uncharacterized protein LOC132703808 [Cylas formicarius]|uniref:uncharacterized protein LOC132703808 n=1 Tax=Cylas formicarius TaxID=197179 RepID=UPI002958D376|nr:uncharacterized protein LOC132703808 [Cylas formicarius]
MPKEKPEYTSTPNAMPRVLGRRGIKDPGNLQSSSPLSRSSFSQDTCNPDTNNEQISYESTDDSEEMHQFNSDTEKNERKEWYISESVPNQSNSNNTKFGLIVVLMVICALLLKNLEFSSADKTSLDDLIKAGQQNFTKQDSNFWPSIKVNIREILELKRPRTILFIYETQSEFTVQKIINSISKIGVCHLTSCSKIPVTITGLSLSKPEFIKDYGKVINQFRENLTDSGVMVVKNIEAIPGVVAQAFHSICDDYNSVEKRALILLTMTMDAFPGTHSSLLDSVEEKLQKLWKDISLEGVFHPLFTRITSTILQVHSEEIAFSHL